MSTSPEASIPTSTIVAMVALNLLIGIALGFWPTLAQRLPMAPISLGLTGALFGVVLGWGVGITGKTSSSTALSSSEKDLIKKSADATQRSKRGGGSSTPLKNEKFPGESIILSQRAFSAALDKTEEEVPVPRPAEAIPSEMKLSAEVASFLSKKDLDPIGITPVSPLRALSRPELPAISKKISLADPKDIRKESGFKRRGTKPSLASIPIVKLNVSSSFNDTETLEENVEEGLETFDGEAENFLFIDESEEMLPIDDLEELLELDSIIVNIDQLNTEADSCTPVAPKASLASSSVATSFSDLQAAAEADDKLNSTPYGFQANTIKKKPTPPSEESGLRAFPFMGGSASQGVGKVSDSSRGNGFSPAKDAQELDGDMSFASFLNEGNEKQNHKSAYGDKGETRSQIVSILGESGAGGPQQTRSRLASFFDGDLSEPEPELEEMGSFFQNSEKLNKETTRVQFGSAEHPVLTRDLLSEQGSMDSLLREDFLAGNNSYTRHKSAEPQMASLFDNREHSLKGATRVGFENRSKKGLQRISGLFKRPFDETDHGFKSRAEPEDPQASQVFLSNSSDSSISKPQKMSTWNKDAFESTRMESLSSIGRNSSGWSKSPLESRVNLPHSKSSAQHQLRSSHSQTPVGLPLRKDLSGFSSPPQTKGLQNPKKKSGQQNNLPTTPQKLRGVAEITGLKKVPESKLEQREATLRSEESQTLFTEYMKALQSVGNPRKKRLTAKTFANYIRRERAKVERQYETNHIEMFVRTKDGRPRIIIRPIKD